ncbi:MAG: glycosyltransferase [Nostocales cyanobacterium]|nr:MAG: glycosyltransferase [Nostocales cyanobacterium]
MNQPIYSLVIPIFNEEENIIEMYNRLTQVIEKLDGKTEIILIDDGSSDHSLNMIRELHQQDSRVCYLSLGRNFGHQIAVTAGLNFVQGKSIIVMDADLQDPPELILEMIEKWQQGYQIVYAQRVSRQQEKWSKRLTAYLFYRILRRLTKVDIPVDTGDFCLMDRQVVNILNSMPERNRYVRGLRAWVGFSQTSVLFTRSPRYAGDVKYTFSKSLSLAIDGIISFSRVPLRLATYLGLISAIVALIMILLVLYWRVFTPVTSLIGYTLITIAMFFLGSVQLICIGILGEYIGRIYEEVKGRPLYTLKETGGLVKNYIDSNLPN